MYVYHSVKHHQLTHVCCALVRSVSALCLHLNFRFVTDSFFEVEDNAFLELWFRLYLLLRGAQSVLVSVWGSPLRSFLVSEE